jgi:pyruvate,water dikinase
MAPLTVGTAPRLLPDVVASAVATVTRRVDVAPDAIIGQPASPGRATGTVRVIGDTDDFARFEPGEILVARTMAPAWTPLLTRAAAVVTDGGTLAAHASLIAREFGVPAVVATGDATARLHDGQIVTVDGSAGVVHV